MPSAHLIELTDANFDAEAASPLPLLIDFATALCSPCRAIAPHVDAIADAYAGRARVAKVDVDEQRELAARFDVRSVPTLVVLKEGRVVGQMVGAAPRGRIEALLGRALG